MPHHDVKKPGRPETSEMTFVRLCRIIQMLLLSIYIIIVPLGKCNAFLPWKTAEKCVVILNKDEREVQI